MFSSQCIVNFHPCLLHWPTRPLTTVQPVTAADRSLPLQDWEYLDLFSSWYNFIVNFRPCFYFIGQPNHWWLFNQSQLQMQHPTVLVPEWLAIWLQAFNMKKKKTDWAITAFLQDWEWVNFDSGLQTQPWFCPCINGISRYLNNIYASARGNVNLHFCAQGFIWEKKNVSKLKWSLYNLYNYYIPYCKFLCYNYGTWNLPEKTASN